MKILIVRLSSIGDIIHTYPMVYEIKKNIKNCTIDWVVDGNFKELVEINCNVDNIISIPLRKYKKNKFKLILEVLKWKNTIKNLNYDYIIDSQGLIKSALVAKFFNGNIYGYSINSIKEKFACIFYKNRINVDKNNLAINKNRILSANIFNYNIDIKSVDFGIQNCLTDCFYHKKFIEKKYIVIFHATSKNSKQYPQKNWADIINYIINKLKFSVVLPYGNIIEKNESFQIKNNVNNSNDSIIIPDNILNFKNLTNLIYNCQMVLGVDTGLVHLSNSLNKKTIAIYTDTDPNKTGIFESNNAINIGDIGFIPDVSEIISSIDNMLNA